MHRISQYLVFFTVSAFSFFLISCDKEDENAPESEIEESLNEENYSLDFFYSGMSTLNLEVVYEEGAEPIIERSGFLGSNRAWDLSQNNIQALFDNRNDNVTVNVPLELSEMREIPKQDTGDYTSSTIVQIAGQYRQGVNEGSSGNIFVAFVDAYYAAGGERKSNVLGVAIKNTPYVAIFKPVINSISGQNAQRGAEQATVIHEVGHALGLVNFGVPLTSQHHDEEHGAHCTNQDCVMYWKVENKSDMVSFIGLINDENSILFGSECLNDTRSYTP